MDDYTKLPKKCFGFLVFYKDFGKAWMRWKFLFMILSTDNVTTKPDSV